MKTATIANYGSNGQVEFAVVTIHNGDNAIDTRKYVCKDFANEGEYTNAIFGFIQSQTIQQVNTVKELLSVEEATCSGCEELVSRISHAGLK